MFRNICLGLITATILFAGISGGFFLIHLTRTTLPALDSTIGSLDKTTRDLDSSAQKMSGIADKVSLTVDKVNQTTSAESKFLEVESREFLKTTASIRQIIVSTDYNLNKQGTGLLPKLNAAVDSQNQALLSLQDQATKVLAQASTTIDGVQPIEKNLSDATYNLNDAIVKTTPAIVDTSKSLQAAAADGKEVADAYKQKLLHPLHSVWGDFKAVLGVTVSFLEIHAFWP